LYDGPFFRVLRSFLRDYHWPLPLSVGVLSAKYGMIGGLSHVTGYDQRMTRERATELAASVSKTLQEWSCSHQRIDLIIGQDYVRSIEPTLLSANRPFMKLVEGPIGVKLNRLHGMLRAMGRIRKLAPKQVVNRGRPLYFLPDWDDFLDVDYDFTTDTF